MTTSQLADSLRDELRELDVTATLHRAGQAVSRRREVELEDLLVVLHYADLHSADPRDNADRLPGKGGPRLTELGGDGTPGVQDLPLLELAIARGVHSLALRSFVADGLDLRHRLSRTYEELLALRCDLWLARRIAAMTRHLSHEAVQLVDVAVAAAIAGQAPSRVIVIAEAKIIEADPVGHRAKIEEARRRRYVGLSRTDETGLREVIARVEAGEAAWVDATVDRVADILASTCPLTDSGSRKSRDELRADAFGWLARPAELLALLLEHAEPDREPEPEQSRATAFPADLLAALRSWDPRVLRPNAVLHVHLHQDALDSLGVARCEELGPMLGAQVTRLLQHANVVVKPVIDLAERVSVNCYEFPTRIAERIHLLRPGDQFPHASAMSRKADLDHPKSYDPDGPPGQTNSHEGQPLTRTGHRAKTHLGYRCAITPTGEAVWRTPHGLARVVGSRGTHPIDPDDAEAWLRPHNDLDRALTRLWHQLQTGQLV